MRKGALHMESPVKFVIAFSGGSMHGNYCPMHAHKGVEIVFHPTGKGTTRMDDGRTFEFAPGDTVVYAPGVAHDQTMESSGIDNCIQISFDSPELLEAMKSSFILKDMRSQSLLMELADLAHWREDESPMARDFRAAALLHSLLHESSKALDGRPNQVSAIALEARRIVYSEIQRPPSVAEIAKIVGVSGDYLRHVFKSHFGKGIKEFSLEARMERAKDLLANSPMGLKEVSAECGFANERALCAAFKIRTGSTPGDYRTHMRTTNGA